MISTINADPEEVAKFSELADRWWDPTAEFRPLHDINPIRLDWINRAAKLKGKIALDVGCGGGLVSEGMAALGAKVTGIDLSDRALGVARLHQQESNFAINYQHVSAEDFANAHPASFDVVTCLEMLEHVPDPASTVHACAQLAKSRGRLFFSTLNRNPKSYLMAVIGAEYVLRLLPRGTHDYAKFIRPAELASYCRKAGLTVDEITGLDYDPFKRTAKLTADTSVNYLLRAHRD